MVMVPPETILMLEREANDRAAGRACANTDRELYREPDKGNGSYYSDSIFVTAQGGIGIDCGGYVMVKSIREWFALAAPRAVFADLKKD